MAANKRNPRQAVIDRRVNDWLVALLDQRVGPDHTRVSRRASDTAAPCRVRRRRG